MIHCGATYIFIHFTFVYFELTYIGSRFTLEPRHTARSGLPYHLALTGSHVMFSGQIFLLFIVLLLAPLVKAEGADGIDPQECVTVEMLQGETDIPWDPLEPMNRVLFFVDSSLHFVALDPLSQGIRYVVPRPVRHGVANFFDNLSFPVKLLGDIIMLKGKRALEHTKAFALNTTVGILGFNDVAADYGVKPTEYDIGTALQYNGVGAGFYLVLPLFGSLTLRDSVTVISDYVFDPVTYFTEAGSGNRGLREGVLITDNALLYVSIRDKSPDEIEEERAAERQREAHCDSYNFAKFQFVREKRKLLAKADVE